MESAQKGLRSEVRVPRFAVQAPARDPERIPGLSLPPRPRRSLPASPVPQAPSDGDRLASLTSQYLSTWFLRAPLEVIPLTLEQRHLVLLQAQLHASRVLLKDQRSQGQPEDPGLAKLIRRMQRQAQWLSMGVSAQDIADCSDANPGGELPETAPPVSRPPLEFMAAANT